MTAQAVETVVAQLADAGLKLALAPAGGLAGAGAAVPVMLESATGSIPYKNSSERCRRTSALAPAVLIDSDDMPAGTLLEKLRCSIANGGRKNT